MRAHHSGYTMVEVMIFLAISGAMLSWSVLALRTRQRNVEFAQTVRDVELKLTDVANDVSTGYYPNAVGFRCIVDPTGTLQFPAVGGGADTSGQNEACIFLGKAVQFGVDGDDAAINTYTILGRRLDDAGNEVTTLKDAHPKALLSTSGYVFDFTDTISLPWGIKVRSASSGLTGFFTTFARSSARGLESGSLGTEPVVIPGPANNPFLINQSKAAAVSAIADLRTSTPPVFNTQTLCLERSDGEEFALITMGSPAGRSIQVNTQISGEPC